MFRCMPVDFLLHTYVVLVSVEGGVVVVVVDGAVALFYILCFAICQFSSGVSLYATGRLKEV